MSKLLDLFNDATKFGRLNALPTPDMVPGKFSARNQSNIEPSIQQTNAVNFVDPMNKIQDEFTVHESKNALVGLSKSPETNVTKFTNLALSTYDSYTNDIALQRYQSALGRRYVATDENTHYGIRNGTSVGLMLKYTGEGDTGVILKPTIVR